MTGAIKAVRKYEKAAKRKVKKPNRDLSDVEEAPEETIRSLRHPCYSFSHRIVKTGSLGFLTWAGGLHTEKSRRSRMLKECNK